MRVTFLVDGFNLYHSASALQTVLARDAAKAGNTAPIPSVKWLNLRSLLASYLPLISRDATLAEVHYFSAYAHFMEARKPGTVARHQNYVACLEDTGVVAWMGRFKEKPARCRACGSEWMRPEEKETDVAIATTLLELVCADRCDTAIIVSGDTDLAPALRAAKRIDGRKRIGFLFPYQRKNSELSALAPEMNFRLKKDRYLAHQLADPYVLANGTQIAKPAHW